VTQPAEWPRLLGELVTLERGGFAERRHAEGFLVAASDAWLVLHQVSDRLDLDGYACFRSQDVTGLSATARRLEVVRRALAMKTLKPIDPGALDLSSTRSLLDSIQATHGVPVIHRERRDPQVCEIGRIRLDAEQTYTLHWLSPDAGWEPDDRVFRYDDVTRIGFGGGYESTLAALAGPPPGNGPAAEDEEAVE
jgi:hypothetical protein